MEELNSLVDIHKGALDYALTVSAYRPTKREPASFAVGNYLDIRGNGTSGCKWE